jgi:hypothetical protein
MGAWDRRSNEWEVTMTTSLQKSQLKRGNILKQIKVEGEVDEGREVIVCCETGTPKWKGFESQMVIWTKICKRI